MSEKNRDAKNRWRTVTVAFRLSPEENEELTNRVKMCGCRTRQEYIIQSILHQKVVACLLYTSPSQRDISGSGMPSCG